MLARRILMLLTVLAAAFAVPSGAASAWTPTPERVVFVSGANGKCRIFTMNPDGSGRVGPLPGGLDPAFSPGGGEIAYVSGKPGDSSEVWLMNADGSNPHPITFDAVEYVRSPAWSSDGNSIVFQRSVGYADPSKVDHDLHMIQRVAGGGWSAETSIVSTPAWEYSPAIAPDGRIAYVSDPDGSGPKETDIWLTDATGSSLTPLVTKAGAETHPSWSSDGSQLTYSRSYVYSYNLATGTETALTTKGATYPDWSTTRNEIIFTSGGDLHRLDLTRSPSRTTNLTRASKTNDLDGDW
jgi:Tol biopolymer transport system component